MLIHLTYKLNSCFFCLIDSRAGNNEWPSLKTILKVRVKKSLYCISKAYFWISCLLYSVYTRHRTNGINKTAQLIRTFFCNSIKVSISIQ